MSLRMVFRFIFSHEIAAVNPRAAPNMTDSSQRKSLFCHFGDRMSFSFGNCEIHCDCAWRHDASLQHKLRALVLVDASISGRRLVILRSYQNSLTFHCFLCVRSLLLASNSMVHMVCIHAVAHSKQSQRKTSRKKKNLFSLLLLLFCGGCRSSCNQTVSTQYKYFAYDMCGMCVRAWCDNEFYPMHS